MEHDGAVNATVFSDDGEMLAVGSASGITVWSLRNPAQPAILHKFPSYSGQLAFVLDDSHLLSIMEDGIHMFDLASAEADLLTKDIQLNNHSRTIARWALSPDGHYISIIVEERIGGGSFTRTYNVLSWHLETKQLGSIVDRSLTTLDSNTFGWVTMAYESSNSELLVSINNRQWLLGYYACDCTGGFTWPDIFTMAYHPDIPLLAAGTTSGEIRLYWDYELSGLLYGINGHVHTLEFSPQGNYIAAHGADNSVRVWRVEDQQRLGSVVYQRFGSGFIPDADESSFLSDTHSWDLATGQQAPLPALPAGNLLQIRPDGNFVIHDAQAGTYGIYNSGDERFISEVVLESPTYRQTLSQDGSRLAYVSIDRYGNESVRVIDLDAGRMIQHWERLWEQPSQLLFSPDNRFLMVHESGSQGRRAGSLVLLEVESGDLIVHIPLAEGVNYIPEERMAYSPDGTRIAWVSFEMSDQTPISILHIFDLLSRQEIATVEIPSFNRQLLFNADGNLIALAGSGSIIHLLDSATGQEIRALEGHLGDISQIMFSRDGRRLYSTAADSQLRIWGVAP